MATLNDWFGILPTAMNAALAGRTMAELAPLHIHTGVLCFNVGTTLEGLTPGGGDFTPLFRVGATEITAGSALTVNEPTPVNHQVAAGGYAHMHTLNALMEAAVAVAASLDAHVVTGEHYWAGGTPDLFVTGGSPASSVLAIEVAFLAATEDFDIANAIEVRNSSPSSYVPGGVTFEPSLNWSGLQLERQYPGSSLPQGSRLPPLPYLLALMVPTTGGGGAPAEPARPLWPFLAGAIAGMAS